MASNVSAEANKKYEAARSASRCVDADYDVIRGCTNPSA
jgi:hypothetical protein